MLRRLHSEQPTSFAFTPDNQAWAEAQITKFPEAVRPARSFRFCGGRRSRRLADQTGD